MKKERGTMEQVHNVRMPETFLLDEVRCGFVVPSAVKQAWAAELEVLAEIDRVCGKHGITYFADWGTLLGTVRHGGFVPWDDDIDIVMKRADYQRFLSEAVPDMAEGFSVQTYRNQKDFWLFMGKVVGRNRFCFEKEHLRKFHNFPYIACVDVFVLDYVHPDSEKEEKRRTLCKYLLGVADGIAEGKLSSEDRERHLRNLEGQLGKRLERLADPVAMARRLYGEVEELFAEVPEKEAEELTQLFPWGLKGNGYRFPKEYYEDPIRLPFEYTTMPVPGCYDRMLRMRYGDYLRPVKDAGAHNYPFFEGQKRNLQKVLDFELPAFHPEREKVLHRTEEEAAYRQFSYKDMLREGMDELGQRTEQIAVAISQRDTEAFTEIITAGQQLAITMGNLLEQMRGEDCSIVPLLEQYCEVVYRIYESGQDAEIPALRQILEDVREAMEQQIWSRKTVLFLPVRARDWTSLQALWQQAKDDPMCDVYVMSLPYYYKDYDGSPLTEPVTEKDFSEELTVSDAGAITEEYLELLRPETIVIQNPYDAWNPVMSVVPAFYAENLRKYTDRLIYVPPFAPEKYTADNAREYSNMKYYVNMPGVVYADRILVEAEWLKTVYAEYLTECMGKDTRPLWQEKLCVTEQEKTEPCLPADGSRHLLYGIGMGTFLENASVSGQKLRKNLDIFTQYGETIRVDVCLFPDAEDTFAECQHEIREEIAKYPMIREVPGDNIRVRDYDAYYGDPMPVVTKFLQEKKTVMIQDYQVLQPLQ